MKNEVFSVIIPYFITELQSRGKSSLFPIPLVTSRTAKISSILALLSH